MKLLILIFIACVAGASLRAEQKLPDSLGLGAPRMPASAPTAAAPVQPVPPMGQEAAAAAAPAAETQVVATAAPTTESAAPVAADPNAPAVAADSPEAKAAQAKITGTESIRKLISEQPDPSLVLEPPTEAEAAKVAAIEKAAAAPKPPARPVASAPTAQMAIGNDPGGQNAVKQGARLRVGRIPGEIPIVPEVSIILVENSFYPARIRLKEGVQARLFFTTTNDKPAAIIVEQMQIQRWVAKEKDKHISAVEAEKEKIRFEATREVTSNKVTEVLLEPRRGSYSFVDVISGAKGQLTVE